jgi:diguanylate cyclase (GGDEF)-like protein
LMATPLVYADFQNLDDENRLRLTCAGTRQDLERQGIELREGLRLTLYTDDANDEGQPDKLVADGIVQYNQGEKCWVAAIDWNAIRHESDARQESDGHFQFTEAFGDARVEELKLLSWTAQHGELSFASVPSGPWHDLLVALVSSELLTVFTLERAKQDFSSPGNAYRDMVVPLGMPGDTPLVRAIALAKVRAVYDLYERRPPAGLRLTHAGRVRLSELKQALRTGREREPFGILWDVRHWQQDVQIAILDSREGAPLALAYLDMNGLKQVNDTYGHDAGDLALRAYFQAVASVLGDRGQAYRHSGGGDEMLVVLPNHDAEAAVRLLRLACTKLMGERLEPTGAGSLLSISVGVTTTSDPSASPTELRSVADKVQYRAKVRSREATPRPSVIAIDGRTDMIVIEHSADPGSRVA